MEGIIQHCPLTFSDAYPLNKNSISRSKPRTLRKVSFTIPMVRIRELKQAVCSMTIGGKEKYFPSLYTKTKSNKCKTQKLE